MKLWFFAIHCIIQYSSRLILLQRILITIYVQLVWIFDPYGYLIVTQWRRVASTNLVIIVSGKGLCPEPIVLSALSPSGHMKTPSDGFWYPVCILSFKKMRMKTLFEPLVSPYVVHTACSWRIRLRRCVCILKHVIWSNITLMWYIIFKWQGWVHNLTA